jgi:PadR family transcriptional regulator PadR
LELCVLRIVRSSEVYTSDISDRLKSAELLVVEGTLYPLLTRMKNAGWLSYRWEESKSGPPRKYYQITPAGEAFLAQLEREWTAFTQAVDTL